MRIIYLVLVSFFLHLGCRPSTESIPGDSIVQNESQESGSNNIIWVNGDLGTSVAKEIDALILLFIYDNTSKSSVDIDLITFCNSEVANYINTNFIPIRASYESIDGSFLPSTIMITDKEGTILLSTIGFIDADNIINLLEQAQLIHIILKKDYDLQDKNNQSFQDYEREEDGFGKSSHWTKI